MMPVESPGPAHRIDSSVDLPMDYPFPVFRWIAFGVDYLVIAAYVAHLLVVTLAVDPHVAARSWHPLQGQVIGIITLTLPVVLYFTLWESSPWSATPGKRLLGLAVVHHTGRRLGTREAFARSALKFVPWEIAHTVLWRIPGWPRPTGNPPSWAWVALAVVWSLVLAYIIAPFFSPQRRAPYDKLTGTVVVRVLARRAAV